ncbi:MAG: T9SS type A sorting domain-containing protein [Ignavibacteriales bacterium]|nr:T9SS type A sorting domain-containing protein [Ignavibacteriales bacterium]
MRYFRLTLLAFFLLLTCSSLKANDWEFQFSIKQSGQFISQGISVYYYDSSAKKYIGCGGGTSLNYGNWQSGTWNAVGNISGVSGDQENATFTIPNYDEYVVVIGTKYVRIQNCCADQTFYYSDGSLTTEGNNQVVASGTWADYSITLKNNFAGGGMYINSEYHSNIPLSGITESREGSTFPHTLTAVDGQTGSDSYKRLWKIWSNSYSSISQDLSSAGNYTTLEAQFDKEFNLTFQASGSMYINGSTRSSSWTEYVRDQYSISAYGNGYTSNGLDYTFTNWTSVGQSYSSPVTATAHKTYTASYTVKPTNSGEYASAGGTVGQPVVVTWTDNPNTAVNQFQIWRRVKHNGVTGDPVLLTTVGRGVQTYTDYDYAVTSGYTNDLLWYDVRAYYSTGNTYSDPDWTAVYGMENPNIQSQDGQFITTTTEIPTDYSIANYPNPFNPTTSINYQLPENGFVTIKVYDMLGKEVAVLVNENKSAGYHRVNFDASKLTSGVYVYTITANNFIQSKKMLLMK